MASGFEKLPVLRSDVSSVRAAGKLSFKRKSEGESTRGKFLPIGCKVNHFDHGGDVTSSQSVYLTNRAPPPRFNSGEEEPPSSLLSPTKALRVALLKRRFADTILRAQEKQVLHNVVSHRKSFCLF